MFEPKSQYIDDDGKARMIVYEDRDGTGLSLIVSPYPPFDIPVSREILRAKLRDVKRFVKEQGMMIKGQDRVGERIQGVWLDKDDSEFFDMYVPLEITKAMNDVPSIGKNAPLITNSSSELVDMQELIKASRILEQYTLLMYAHAYSKGRKKKGFSFDENSFIIDPKYRVDVDAVGKGLDINSKLTFKGGKLIVPSAEIRDRLINYTNVQLLNDRQGVLSYRNKTTMDNYYHDISDFRSDPNQIIFTSRDALVRWSRGDKNKAHTFKTRVDPTSLEPYFYRNASINAGRRAIIQNVEDGDKLRAMSVVKEWNDKKINEGYRMDIEEGIEKNPYVVYDEEGYVEGDEGGLALFAYPNNLFAALLFI